MMMNISFVLRVTVFCLVLAIFFVQQGSFVLLLSRRNITKDSEWICITLWVILIPYVISLLSQIWRSSFSTGGKWKEWPHWGHLTLGVVSSIVEGYILTNLVWSLLPRIPGFLLPGVLYTGLFATIIISPKIGTCCRYTQFVLKFIFIACLLATAILLVTTNYLSTGYCVPTFLSLIIMSVILTPKFQTFIHLSADIGRQNSALLYVILKILSCVISIYFLQRHDDNDNEIQSIKQFLLSIELPKGINLWLCVITIVSFLLCQTVLYVKDYSIKTKLNIHLSVYLASITVAVCVLLACVGKIDVSSTPAFETMKKETWDVLILQKFIPLYICVGGLMVIPILLDFLQKGNSFKAENSYNVHDPVFILQSLLSSVCGNKSINLNKKSIKKRQRRIFICTTMYQESNIEMDRLLASIKNISNSKLLKKEHVSIESHIFLDNGADGQDIKQFGLQLLGLVEDNLISDKDKGIMLFTPYGIQLSWQLDSGVPLFLHLKDNSKVKAKKRWSQVMYMKYVINYRSVKYSRNLGHMSKITSYASLLSVDSMTSMFEKTPDAQNNLTVPLSKMYNPSRDSGMISDTTEPTNIPFVEIFVGDTSSLGNLSDKPDTDNGISTISETNITYSDSFDVDVDEYILATDADMTFVDESIMDVLHMCESDAHVGAVCGRTRPKGVHIHPIVWLQIFDYAKDFWIIKSSQNIIGSVMCCPGCFSMYKLDAVRDVVDEYSGPVNNMEDVFTKDNGEDRWMCTLMMLKGWKLRYSSNARNTTFCPEDTAEFMKQRRRWLLSDYANAILVIRKLRELISKNDGFSVLYTLYLLQLFLIMLLYPGSTIVMLCLGLELSTGAPLIIVTPVIVVVILAYCLVLLGHYSVTVQMVITKLLIMIFGAGTAYIFVATSYIIFKDLAIGFQTGNFEHAEGFLVMIVIGSYVYGALLYPTDIWILAAGVVYLFFIPFMNLMLPLYAVCNIVDQSWGTRDNQKATVPKFLQLPKIKRRMKKKMKPQVETTSLHSLSASSLSISDYNQSEYDFWDELVTNIVGSDVYNGISDEERRIGLRKLRKKALMFFLIANLICVVLLVGFYAFLMQELGSKSTFSIVMGVTLGLSPLIQVSGSTVYRIDDVLTRIGRWVSS